MADRFVFFGIGANFTMAVLDELLQSDYLPSLVVVPEFPAGRIKTGFELQHLHSGNHNPLILFAEAHDIPLAYAPQIELSALLQQLDEIEFEFILVACWPYKIPSEICSLANKAAMNIHPSLLPAYRGPDPIGDQIANREKQPGVSLHLISSQFDAGDIVAAAPLDKPFNLERTYLENQAARLGAKLFVQACENFGSTSWQPRPQN